MLLGSLFLAARPAHAQVGTTLSGGGGVVFYRSVDEMAGDSTGFALVYRFGRPDGLQPTFGFNWYSTTFDTAIAGTRLRLGELHVRPVMGGYGYGATNGRVSMVATLIGGIAFNSFDTADAVRIAYDRQLDSLLLDVSASNSLAARAEVSIWYDVSGRIALMASAGYVAARPTITVTTETSRESRRLRADAVKFQVGVVYAIF